MKMDVLPSDWRFREDLLWIAYNKKDYADEWKEELENAFRRDRKKREKFKKNLK